MLTTHYLEEADAQAERVMVIDHGEIIADDTAAALKATLAGDRDLARVRASRPMSAAGSLVEPARTIGRAPPTGGAALRSVRAADAAAAGAARALRLPRGSSCCGPT